MSKVDSLHIMRYNSGYMKKILFSLIVLAVIAFPKAAFAEGETTVCTQSYGGGVVCGVHTPVNTGIADNIPLIASGFLGAGGVLAYFSRKFKKAE